MEQKQSSSQIKANPISNENVEENDIQEKTEVEQQQQLEEQKNTQKKQQNVLKPEFVYCPNNKSIEDLIKTYPHLQSLNDAKEVDWDAVQEAESYIIRSNNDDDIHKAIKYQVWCSTPPNNERLDEAFKKAQEEKKDIYLFYSVVKSGQFVGVAKLKSALNEETFAYWWQHAKWRGHFKIEWLFVKDITYKQFENLKNEEKQPVIRSKDGTKIDWKETGQPMIKIYQGAKDEPNIFQDFEHMDQREQFQRYIRSTNAQGQYQQQGQQQQNMYYPQQQMMYYQQYPQQGQQQGQQNYYHPYYQQQYYQQPRFNNAFPPTGNNQYRGNQNYNGNHQGGYKKQYYKKNYNNNGYNNNKNYNNNRQYHNNKQQSNNQQRPQQQQQQQQQQPQQQQQQQKSN